MSTEDDRRYYGIFLEEMRDSFKVVTEAVTDMQRAVEVLPTVQEDIAGLKDDMKAVKAALTDLSREVRERRVEANDHERRITRLEAA